MFVRTRSRGAPLAAPKILALSFAAAALVGFLLLALPVSSADGRWHADVPRLFTATSAICVTGLDPIGVGAALSPFGLAVLTLLAQLGGIGIMTVGTFLFVAIGRTLSVTEERSVASSLGEMRPNNMRRILTGTLVFTFAWELAGAVFLAWRLRAADAALPLGKAAAHGAFFSVMSFCNAGFSLHADSFAPFLHDPSIVLCSVVLSLVGGIGFLVHANLFSLRPWYRNRIARGRLTLHSRLVLEGLLAVVALDLLVYLSLEWNGAYAGLGARDTFCAALFQTFSTRSSGFAAVPAADLCGASRLFTIVMMFVGAAPGSTGGGLKTTTVAVLGATVLAMFRARETPEIHDRSISRRIVNDAVAILALSLCIVLVAAFGLLLLERPGPDRAGALVFEAVSAFVNNGLEIGGTTAALSRPSQILLSLCMFVGRLGPATIALTLFHPHVEDRTKRFPEENVIVG